MKNIKFIIRAALLLAICAVIQACSKDSGDTATNRSTEFSINAMVTRADGDSVGEQSCYKEEFDNNDKFSLFVWSGGASVDVSYNNLIANNVIYTLNYDAWFGASEILFSSDDSEHTLSAIYPHTEYSYIDQLEAIAYPSESDVLFAKMTFTPANGAVDLEFNHIMSLLDIELTYEDFEAEEVNDVKVNLSVKDSSVVDVFTGDVTADGGIISLTINVDEEGDACRIMVPQSINLSDLKVEVDGRNYVYSGDKIINLVSGERTKCSLTIKKHYEEFTTNVNNATWNDGGDYVFQRPEDV